MIVVGNNEKQLCDSKISDRHHMDSSKTIAKLACYEPLSAIKDPLLMTANWLKIAAGLS